MNSLRSFARKRWYLIAIVPAVALRAYLAIFRFEWLWYDEAFSVLAARLPLQRLVAATAGDVHPPFYYLLLKGWLAISGPLGLEAGGRSLSLVISLFSLCLHWRLLPRLGICDRRQRVSAWLLAAYVPALFYFASETRMYALLELELLGALYVLMSPEGEAPRFRRAAVGGLLLGAAALTHNVALFFAPCLAIAIFIRRIANSHCKNVDDLLTATDGQNQIRNKIAMPLAEIAITAVVALLVWAPWARVLLQQVGEAKRGYWLWHNGIGTLCYMVFQSVFYARIADWLSAAVMFFFVGMTASGLILERDKPWLAILALGPATLAWGVSELTGMGALLHRTITTSVYAMMALWSSLLVREDVGRVLIALCIAAFGVANASYLTRGRDVANFSWLQRIEEQPGDVIYSSNNSALPLSLYIDAPIYYAPTSERIGDALSLQTQEALGLQVKRLSEIEGWRRAWLIYQHLPHTLPGEEEYVAELIERYDSERVALTGADGATTDGELWLLERSAAAR